MVSVSESKRERPMRHRPLLSLLAWLALMLALSACGKKDAGGATEGAPSGAKPVQAQDRGALQRDEDARTRIAASIITIAHAGVTEYSSRRPKPSRSEAEALELARALVTQARQAPARFEDLARERSEDPIAPDGGNLGTWSVGDRPDLDAAVGALKVGEVSEPIASAYGYRILRRDPPLPDERISARHLVVAWAGAVRASSAVTRAKAEARARAEELAARARKDPASFEALIRAESDGWNKDQGGYLGAWTMNGERFPAAFDRAVYGLAEGAISGPIESQFGYHLFQRLPVQDATSLLSCAHILIAFEGAEKARPAVRRSKEEAREEAERILAEARRDPSRFGQLATAHSDDATRKQGGDLGSFRRGTMPSVFEEAMTRLKIGEVGGPVLTQYGYHVLLRREAPTDKDYVVH